MFGILFLNILIQFLYNLILIYSVNKLIELYNSIMFLNITNRDVTFDKNFININQLTNVSVMVLSIIDSFDISIRDCFGVYKTECYLKIGVNFFIAGKILRCFFSGLRIVFLDKEINSNLFKMFKKRSTKRVLHKICS